MFLFFCVYDDVFKLSIYDHNNRLEMISNQNCIVCREEEKKIETVYFSNMIVTQQQQQHTVHFPLHAITWLGAKNIL